MGAVMTGILIALGVIAAGVVLVLLISFGASKVAKAAAPYADKGWEYHCKRCGARRDVAELGMVRVKVYSRGKRTYRRCHGCRKRSWLAIERTGRRD